MLHQTACFASSEPDASGPLIKSNTSGASLTPTKQQHDFSIDPSSLAKALVKVVAQSGTGVLVDNDVDTRIQVNALNGTLTVAEALQQLLFGHDLIAELNTTGYYIIRRFIPAEKPHTSRYSMEEMIVTGTYIKGGLGRTLNPLKVINHIEMHATGSPSMIDLVATLPSVSGTENQSNQFHNVNAAGTANINLRGLGVSRSLVLLNGKRLAPSALPHNDGQAFVDINTIPAIALEQVDILKNGASATYGSDAVAGVVNFITRRDFEGLELITSAKHIEESDGDWSLGLLSGKNWSTRQGLSGHWLGSLGYSRRGELKNTSREDIIEPRIDIPELQRVVYGISSIGNPGSFIPIDAATAIGGVSDAEVSTAAMGRNNYVRDPECTAVGGFIIDEGRCGFNYVTFDNLVEEEERWQAFTSLELELSEQNTFYSELNYALLELAEWKTSPSYPPVKETDASLYLPATHPGLQDFISNNPGIKESDGDTADFSGGAVFAGRPIGVSGPNNSGYRSQETLRLLTGLRGDNTLAKNLSHDISLAYARNHAESRNSDILIERWQAALQGFGGLGCTGNTPGTNGCEYYNPFSSSIAFSNNYQPALSNSVELLDWMRDELAQKNTSELAVVDAVFSGSLPYSNNAPLDYAFGMQYRQERLKIRFNDLSDVSLNPGKITVPGELPGVYIFFRGGHEDDVTQHVTAIFGELAIPIRHDLLLQLALRYENYSGAVGESTDPKLALSWNMSPALTLRTSVSTTFRAPSLNQTSLDTTSLELIGAAFAFKAVDRIGTPNLAPEQATSYNLGLIWEPNENWLISLDYWRFDLSDVIVQQSANAIVNTALADPTSVYTSQVIYDGSGNISRILSNYVNGPDVLVDGYDFSGQLTADLFKSTLAFGWDLSYLHRYDVSETALTAAFSADGHMNTGTFVKSLPKWQGNLFINLSRNLASTRYNARFVLNAIGSYKDDGLQILEQTALADFVTETKVDAFTTADLHFGMTPLSHHSSQPHRASLSQRTSVTLSVLNITDREPPSVRDDMRFDTTLHNAFGRMVKLSLSHTF